MKALILCGGKGRRLKPLTNTTPKQLLPVANKPILHYVLDQVRDAGISDIGVVVSPENSSKVQQAVGNGSRWTAQITYILQAEPLGIAHAVKTARDFLGACPFLVFLGDNLVQGGVTGFVQEFVSREPDALILLKEVADPRLFGVAELNRKGEIISIVEKPREPKTNLAVPGVYLFTPAVHDAIESVRPSWRGELEITDTIQQLIDSGKRVHSHILTGWWLDTGKKDDLLEANRVVLDEFTKHDVRGDVDAASQLAGRVEVGERTRIEGSIIRGPVSIADDCSVKDSYIGPFTSIGTGTTIDRASIEHSVVLDSCSIRNIERLSDCVIGRCAEVTRRQDGFRAMSLFIGDDAIVDI